MADSGSTRTRRWKLHKAGDHSECRSCDAVRARRAAPAALPAGEGTDPADLPPVDAQALLEQQARRLEAACEAAPGSAALEKELRATLLAIRGGGEAADDELAKFWAEFRGA